MEKKNVTNEPGIIGQMYEDRKTKKRGVLEERQSKFKTLMMRDEDGKSFNITYSTFKSNWRKYQGDEVIQTSTQVEEQRAEEKKEVEVAKKEVETEKKVIKTVSTEDKVKKIRAISTVLQEIISKNNFALKTERNSKGGIIVRFSTKKTKVMELWYKFVSDSYELIVADALYDMFTEQFNSTGCEHVYKEKWVMKHLLKFDVSDFDNVITTTFGLASEYVNAKLAEKNKDDNKED